MLGFAGTIIAALLMFPLVNELTARLARTNRKG
jgi:hypothetical protein